MPHLFFTRQYIYFRDIYQGAKLYILYEEKVSTMIISVSRIESRIVKLPGQSRFYSADNGIYMGNVRRVHTHRWASSRARARATRVRRMRSSCIIMQNGLIEGLMSQAADAAAVHALALFFISIRDNKCRRGVWRRCSMSGDASRRRWHGAARHDPSRASEITFDPYINGAATAVDGEHRNRNYTRLRIWVLLAVIL